MDLLLVSVLSCLVERLMIIEPYDEVKFNTVKLCQSQSFGKVECGHLGGCCPNVSCNMFDVYTQCNSWRDIWKKNVLI